MKKKLLALLLVAVAATAGAFGITACNKGGGNSNDAPEIDDNKDTPAKSEFTVIFNANGGKFNGENIELDGGEVSDDGAKLTYAEQKKETFAEPLETPERDGFVFSGWAKDNDGATLWDFETDELKADTTLYAVWSVTFDFALSEDKSFYIVRGLGGLSGNVEIPETYNKKPVKEIAEKAFRNDSRLTGIKIPDCITSIGKNAFSGCGSLVEVTIGEGITEIPNEAFTNCISLEKITIPASVNKIGESAFENQNALEVLASVDEVHFTGTVDDWCAIDFGAKPYLAMGVTVISNPLSNGKAVLYIDGQPTNEVTITAETISQYAFKGCGTINSVTIGNGVNKIANKAFDGSTITELNFADDANVEEIESSAFYNTQIAQLKLPESIVKLHEGAFKDCVKLQTLDLGGTDIVGDGAFSNCYALANVSLGAVEELGNDAFASCESLAEISVPDSVWKIGSECFGACAKLTSVTFTTASDWIVDGANTVSGEALSTPKTAAEKLRSETGVWARVASKLKFKLSYDRYIVTGVEDKNGIGVIRIPNTYENKPVTEIDSRAFADCSGLTSIIIPDSVTSIGDSAFARCRGLTSVTIGNGVTGIGFYAFDSCSGLTNITIPDSVTNIRIYAFDDCSGLTSITVGANNTAYASQDGILYNKAKTAFVCIPEAIKGSITIPDGVTSIGKTAFAWRSGLTNITIPDSVTSIGESAFARCSGLTSITIGSGVMSIGESAFDDCGGLTSITVGANNTAYASQDGILYNKAKTEFVYIPAAIKGSITIPDGVTSISHGAFLGCSGLTSITISDSVTSMGDFAFSGCSGLTNITIPDSVTSMGDFAFELCYSITDIYFCGTEEQWEAFDVWIPCDYTLHYVNQENS